MNTLKQGAVCLLSVGLLSGCVTATDDLQSWMTQTRAAVPRAVTEVAEPRQFEPFRYEPTSDTDPFSDAKLQQELARIAAARPGGGIRPDMNRRRETLEGFPLEEVEMVGQMQRKSTGSVALLRVGGTVYPARVGNYVGQNHGRILAITEHEVKLRELVQDGSGEWVQRDGSLQLQEAMK